jgi:hypothetical protein
MFFSNPLSLSPVHKRLRQAKSVSPQPTATETRRRRPVCAPVGSAHSAGSKNATACHRHGHGVCICCSTWNSPVSGPRSAGIFDRNRPLANSASTTGSLTPGQQRVDDRPPRLAQKRRSHRRQLDPRVLHHLLQPLDRPGPFLDQRAPIPRQIAQRTDIGRRHETRPHQPVLDQLGDPHRNSDIGFRPGTLRRCSALSSHT